MKTFNEVFASWTDWYTILTVIYLVPAEYLNEKDFNYIFYTYGSKFIKGATKSASQALCAMTWENCYKTYMIADDYYSSKIKDLHDTIHILESEQYSATQQEVDNELPDNVNKYLEGASKINETTGVNLLNNLRMLDTHFQSLLKVNGKEKLYDEFIGEVSFLFNNPTQQAEIV